ncbi:hypothetical protein THAOC_18878, partial [Thalassiosira oceanica]
MVTPKVVFADALQQRSDMMPDSQFPSLAWAARAATVCPFRVCRGLCVCGEGVLARAGRGRLAVGTRTIWRMSLRCEKASTRGEHSWKEDSSAPGLTANELVTAVSEALEPSQCITGTSRSPPTALYAFVARSRPSPSFRLLSLPPRRNFCANPTKRCAVCRNTDATELGGLAAEVGTGTLKPNGRTRSQGTTQSPPCLPAGGLLGFQMTDEQSNKRLKTTGAPGAGRRNMNDTRNDALESEIGALKSEVARLRQQLQRQNALLRPLLLSQRLRPLRLKENHETLPVTVSTLTTVNLSDIDTSLVAHVASFVGTSRELLNLALTCKAFGWCLGWCQHESEMWSLAEEVARRAVTTLQNSKSVKLILPEYVRGTRTWLSILHESDRPLKFNTLLGCHIAHSSGDRTSVRGTTERGHSGSAIASGFVMISGLHYAEFEIRGCPYIGIVRPMPNLDLQRLARREDFHFFDMEVFDNCLAARGVRKFGVGIVHACEYCCEDGYSSWTDWDDKQDIMNWDGMEYCRTGDTVGMLLDLGVGILTIYKNSRRLGVMKDGLSGPYCWYASLTRNSAVSIKRGEASSAGGLPRFQMTDGQSNERLKTTARIDRRNNDARNAADESEIGVLKSEVARLKQQLQRQNALLCPLLLSQRLRPLWLQENHNELSVTVSTLTKVNLSYIDTSLIAQVASFVGASRELRNLALTCKAFGWRQTGSDWDWSLAEEVARQIGRSGQNNIDGVRLSLPR